MLRSVSIFCALSAAAADQSIFCGMKLKHSECAAWTAFYNAAGGLDWTECSDAKDNPCDCVIGTPPRARGVKCDAGEITHIILPNNNMHGELASELQHLTHLQRLDIGYNNLGGDIPEIFSNLPALVDIDFSENAFTGPIPKSLEFLPSIINLLMRNNKLTGTIHQSLGSIKTVEKFNFRSNQLTGTLPVSLGNLDKMTNFILWGNQLTGEIPDFFQNMTALKFLRFDRNFFSGSIPESIGTSDVLQGMSVYCNLLTGTVPADFKWDQYSTCGIGGPDNTICDINTTVAGGYHDNQFDCPIPEAAMGCTACRTTDTSEYIFCPATCNSGH